MCVCCVLSGAGAETLEPFSWVDLRASVCLALEEKFAQAVCFLLVDLYLLTFQPEKALHLLAVLDKLSAHGNSKNSKGEVCSCTHTPFKST